MDPFYSHFSFYNYGINYWSQVQIEMAGNQISSTKMQNISKYLFIHPFFLQ